MAFDKQRPTVQWRSAIWLPVWLIGLGIISWQGQFSGSSDKHPLPPTITMNIPFWWDIVVLAAFSLVIYYWAIHSRLPREEMLELVSAQADEPAPPGPELVG
jgi:ABC-type dipeptide/oligopeptide/nickel transport system permease component